MKSEDQRQADKADEQCLCDHLHTRDSNVRGYKRCMDCGKLIGKDADQTGPESAISE